MSVLESITQNRRILKFVDKSILDLSTALLHKYVSI